MFEDHYDAVKFLIITAILCIILIAEVFQSGEYILISGELPDKWK